MPHDLSQPPVWLTLALAALGFTILGWNLKAATERGPEAERIVAMLASLLATAMLVALLIGLAREFAP